MTVSKIKYRALRDIKKDEVGKIITTGDVGPLTEDQVDAAKAGLPWQRFEFSFPMPPTRGNARDAHWGQRYKGQLKYWKACDLVLYDMGLFPYRGAPMMYCHWKAEFFLKRNEDRMDFDNMVARLKWPLDYLQERRIIISDGPDHCWPAELPIQSVGNITKPVIKFTLGGL